MSLFGSLQLAGNALIANQIGLQVTGNNIANANTPGYIRQDVVLTPAATQRQGKLLLGLGVQVSAIVQKTDEFLEERLRGATADLAFGEAQEQAYFRLESAIGELNETDLSTSLTNFFGSIQDVLNQPESVPARNLAVLEGGTLAEGIRRLDSRVRALRSDLNDQIQDSAGQINNLLEEIASLNIKVVSMEGGDASASDAVGLRDQRTAKLKELAELIDVKAVEQENGSMTVFVGGDFVVFEGISRSVEVTTESNRGLQAATVQLEGNSKPLEISAGKLGGLTSARDEILGGFLDKLESFSTSLIYEFNRAYSSGQGLRGFDQLTSEFQVDDLDAELDQAGLPFTPNNGSFQVLVRNKQTGVVDTQNITVSLDGLDDDTSLAELITQLDGIDGLAAEATPTRGLSLAAGSSNLEFAFANDTSGVLAALGVNTFFSGSSALDIGVNTRLNSDPSYFAASSGGIGEDTKNAEILASFQDRPLDSQHEEPLSVTYERIIAETTQAASVSRSVSEGFRVFQDTLEGQRFAVSGVSLDEEAINMISYQRAYQASARYISTVSDLLEMLVNL